MDFIRRCHALYLERVERLDFDPAALFQGETGIRTSLAWCALAPHLPAPVELDEREAQALARFGPTVWLPRAKAETLAGAASLVDRLLALGLLVARNEAPASRADAALRQDAWHPLFAMAHRASRWSSKDAASGLRSVRANAVQERVREFGPPPPECHERSDRKARFALPAAPPTDLDALLERRATCRNYDSSRGLSQAGLGELLDRVFGIRGREALAPGAVALKKNHPSGGAMHSLEPYLLLRRVQGLPPGLYHYACGAGALDLLQELPEQEAEAFILNAVAGQDFFADAPAHVLIAARFARPQWKYRNHAKLYRALHIEVGTAAQNLYLSATLQGLGAYVTAAINEIEIDTALGLEPMREGVLAVCGFGPRASTRTMVEFDPAGKVWPGGTGGG